MAGRVLASGKVEAIPDRLEDPDFVVPMDALGHAARALLGVPLLGKGGVEGALVLTRKEPGHFTDRQIEIVQTFADQAVIAIENVRLFDEVQARTTRTRRLARRSAQGAGSADPIREARLARPTHRGHRPRDQEPAEFRQQFLGAVARTARRTARGAGRRAAGKRPARRGGRADRNGRTPTSTRSCSTASAPIRSSRTCCCIRAKAPASARA